ncbi:MAG: LacI family DNA-binding transcriptional regulator [Gaiellaceae bacterium]
MSHDPATEATARELSATDVYARLEADGGQRGAEAPLAGPPPSFPGREIPPLVAVVSLIPELVTTPYPFWQSLVGVMRRRLLAAGCDVLTRARAWEAAEAGSEAEEGWRRAGVEGVIVIGASRRNDAALERLLRARLPVVLVDFDLIGEQVGHVMSNNLEGMANVVRHLSRLGRRRIATLAGPGWTLPGADRLLGYRSATAALGLEDRDDYVLQGDFTHRSGLSSCRAMLALSEPPDAIAAASDTIAVGAIVALEQSGLRVPEDIAVTGFDDVEFAARMRPALTTVRQDAAGLGRAAADALVTMIADPGVSPPTVLLPTALVVRDSCGASLAGA